MTLTQGSFFYNFFTIRNRKTCSKQKLFRINSKTKSQQTNLYVTNDLDPWVIHYFIKFFTIKNRKTCYEQKLFRINPKTKIPQKDRYGS